MLSTYGEQVRGGARVALSREGLLDTAQKLRDLGADLAAIDSRTGQRAAIPVEEALAQGWHGIYLSTGQGIGALVVQIPHDFLVRNDLTNRPTMVTRHAEHDAETLRASISRAEATGLHGATSLPLIRPLIGETRIFLFRYVGASAEIEPGVSLLGRGAMVPIPDPNGLSKFHGVPVGWFPGTPMPWGLRPLPNTGGLSGHVRKDKHGRITHHAREQEIEHALRELPDSVLKLKK
jgi:hypothetical protein